MKFIELKRSIKSVIWFLPVIWRDRDWQYNFIYELLARKLEKVEHYRQNDKYYMPYVGEERDNKKLLTTKNLCKRLAADEYLSNATINFDKKFPDAFNKMNYEWTKKEEENFKRCCDHSYYMEKQDKDMFFKLLKDNIDRWWD